MDLNKIAIITANGNISYAELFGHINKFAVPTPKYGTKTIIFCENREGWVYAFFAIWQNKGIAVPVDASSTVGDLEYIIKDCSPVCIWTSKANEQTAREAISRTGMEISVLIVDDYENAPINNEIQKDGLPWDSLNKGRAEEPALIIYTSGTTGSPKGVVLSYQNLKANMNGVVSEVPIFNSERRTLMLLPVHHVLPLMGTVIIPISQLGGIAISPTMTAADIMGTLCKGEVAIMIGVPRLWQTLYGAMKKKIDASIVTRTLFNICARVKSRKLSQFVFQSVKKKMGGHITYCVSGGAALDKEIGEGLRTLGLDVLEGYGMTETAPIIAFTRPDDIVPGCVGLPLPSVECKLINGELCAKGPNVMIGYYNRPQETNAVIDKDGFIHTGDLAKIDEKGRVIITGRTKEIIVLSNGKNVQPSEIEYKLEKYDQYVKEAAIVQDGDMLRAIIVPQDTWASKMADDEIESTLKREVLEPYNLTVTNYKKVMSVMVYHGDLPRTKLDKLQRFKLKDILEGKKNAQQEEKRKAVVEEPQTHEYQILKKYIENEKKLEVLPTSHLETDLAFDSLDRVGLQEFIERTFGMKVNADSMSAFKDVASLAEHIAGGKTRVEVEDVNWQKVLSKEVADIQLPTTSPLFTVWGDAFKLMLKIYNRLEIKGRENIPGSGPFIIAPNHQSMIDGPIAVSGLSHKQLRNSYFYATENHVKSGVRRQMAQRNNIIIMEMSNLKESIQKLSAVLRSGKNIIIFPEGSRTHDGTVGNFKKTYAILSKELNVPILPVAITGAFEAMPRGKKYFRPHKITVEYLPVIQPTEHISYDELSNKVRAVIDKKVEG